MHLVKPEHLKVKSYFLVEGRDQILLERVSQDSWAINGRFQCYGKDGKWHHEPQNSSKTEEFRSLCRWDSAEKALRWWIQCQN